MVESSVAILFLIQGLILLSGVVIPQVQAGDYPIIQALLQSRFSPEEILLISIVQYFVSDNVGCNGHLLPAMRNLTKS